MRSLGRPGVSVAVAAHSDVVEVDEGGGVTVVVPDRLTRPEVPAACLGRPAAAVDPHHGALLERIAGQGEPLAAIPGIQFPAGQIDGGSAGVADQRVLAVEVTAIVPGGVSVDAGDRGPVATSRKVRLTAPMWSVSLAL
jgi:hypothetical protein